MVERKEDMSESAKVKDIGKVKDNFHHIEDGLEVDKLSAGVKGLTMSAGLADASRTEMLGGKKVPEQSETGVVEDADYPVHPQKNSDSPAESTAPPGSKEEPTLDVGGLTEGLRGLAIGEGECGTDENQDSAEFDEDPEVGDGGIVEGIRGLSLVERGQGDGSEVPDVAKGQREPEEDGTSEEDFSIDSCDVTQYNRIDSGVQLRNGCQIAQIGAALPLREFDCCDASHHGRPGKPEIVALGPIDAHPTACDATDICRRKGRTIHMTGGGIVGGNETNIPFGYEEHTMTKAMRPMSGAGGFTTSSRSGMSGGSVQTPGGIPGQGCLPPISDELLMSTGPFSLPSLPPIDTVWSQQCSKPILPQFPILPNNNMHYGSTAGQQQQVYQFGNSEQFGNSKQFLNSEQFGNNEQFGNSKQFRNMEQFQNSSHEKEVHKIENFLRTSESDCSEKSVASPFGGSSGIGSPGSSMSAASPGSAYSDGGDRIHKQSESSEDEGVVMGHLTPRRSTGTTPGFDDLDIISEWIDEHEEMGESEVLGTKIQAVPTPVTTQESALKSQLIQPPIYTPPSPQNYAQQCGAQQYATQQCGAQVPQTTSIVPTTTSVPMSMSGAVIVLYNVPNAASMKKGPVPILPKPEGAPNTNKAIPTTQPKMRAKRKSKNGSKSKAPPTPKSSSPKTGPDSVFFPDGSSSDGSMYASSCQMSPMGTQSIPSPGSCGLPCTIQDAQLPMTIPEMTSFQDGQTHFQVGVPTMPMTSFQQSVPMTQMGTMSLAPSRDVGTTLSQGVPKTMSMDVPAALSQNITMTTSNAISSTGFAQNAGHALNLEPLTKQQSSQPINDKFTTPEEFQKPVMRPQKKANRPGLKIDTTCSDVTNNSQSNASNSMSLTPVPASPSTPTTMSQKSRASCTINLLPQRNFEMIDSDGDALLHQVIVHGHLHMVDPACARYKRQGCLVKFINLKNYAGQTPLYLATLCTEVEIVKVLLEYGANVTLTNNDFTSPLHCAAKKCQFGYEILDLLLTMPEKKLDLSVKDCNGMTPLHIAIQAHGVPVEDQSQKTENANGFKKLVPGNSLRMVELLFQHGANAYDKASKDGRNALHFAIERKSLEMMSLVLKYGDARKLVNDTTDSGNTGLHIAAGLQMDNMAIKTRMIQLLKTNGADLDARNRENNRPKDLVNDPKNSGLVIVDLLKIQRHKSVSQSSHPASPQETASKQTAQNTTSKTTQMKSQRSNASQGVPTTNPHANVGNLNSWGNPEMRYMNPTVQNAPEPFIDQVPLYGQGPCETSDNSLEAIATSLGLDNRMDDMNAQTGIDTPYTQADLNALYNQLGGEEIFVQASAHSGMGQQPSQANQQFTQNNVTSTSGMNQQYAQTLTGTSGNTQGYTQTINQLNSQPYSQPGQTYSQQNAANAMTQPMTMPNQYRVPPATTSSTALPYPPSYPTYSQQGLALDNQMTQRQQQAGWNDWTTGLY